MEAVLALTGATASLLWILAVDLGHSSGIVMAIRGSVVAGVVVMIVQGLLVGPGGANVFK